MTVNQKRNKMVASEARKLLKPAAKLLKEEYGNPNRQKLTHYWLAEKLNIPKYTAFILLQGLARRRQCCMQMPDGRIFWLNDQITVGEMIDAMNAPTKPAAFVI